MLYFTSSTFPLAVRALGSRRTIWRSNWGGSITKVSCKICIMLYFVCTMRWPCVSYSVTYLVCHPLLLVVTPPSLFFWGGGTIVAWNEEPVLYWGRRLVCCVYSIYVVCHVTFWWDVPRHVPRNLPVHVPMLAISYIGSSNPVYSRLPMLIIYPLFSVCPPATSYRLPAQSAVHTSHARVCPYAWSYSPVMVCGSDGGFDSHRRLL